MNILVIGSGLVGKLSALELTKRNHSVQILANHSQKNIASSNAAGILFPLQPQLASQQIITYLEKSHIWYDSFASNLSQRSRAQLRYRQSGMRALLQPFDTTHKIFQHTIKENGIYFSKGKTIDPRGLLTTLDEVLLDNNVQSINGEINHVIIDHDRIYGVSIGHTVLSADAYIFCLGAWTSSYLPAIPKVVPTRGILLLCSSNHWLVETPLVFDNGYIVQHAIHQVIIGTTSEAVNFSTQYDNNIISQLKKNAEKHLPSIQQLTVDSILLGFRPTCDQIQCGRHQDLVNCYLHYGHGGHGVACAPASACDLAEKIK
ncbi:MAG: FAD-dependent oxidoreductase [Methylacidiphilales bacterium]|nr:FAD-dependent oxidoreductase [Candidatus Methylacidiphilales bacterium]